jgi:hypothetical protein
MTLSEFPSRPRAVDWRTLSADRVAPLIADEVDRWARLLEWDVAAEWAEIEKARQAGLATGIAVIDENGTIAGWSRYQTRNHVLQVGVFNARSESVTNLMINQILSGPTLAFVQTVSLFALSEAPGINAALRERGLSVDRYFYMARDLGRNSPLSLPDCAGGALTICRRPPTFSRAAMSPVRKPARLSRVVCGTTGWTTRSA